METRNNPQRAVVVYWRPERSSTSYFSARKSDQRRSTLPRALGVSVRLRVFANAALAAWTTF